jgi:hypothetical protein
MRRRNFKIKLEHEWKQTKRVYELTSKGKNLLESTVDSTRICCKIEINVKNNAPSSKDLK